MYCYSYIYINKFQNIYLRKFLFVPQYFGKVICVHSTEFEAASIQVLHTFQLTSPWVNMGLERFGAVQNCSEMYRTVQYYRGFFQSCRVSKSWDPGIQNPRHYWKMIIRNTESLNRIPDIFCLLETLQSCQKFVYLLHYPP